MTGTRPLPVNAPGDTLPDGWRVVTVGDLLEESDVRARDVDGGVDLPVLSLTKAHGLIEQSRRFHQRVARADVSDYKVVEQDWIAHNPMVLWEGAIHGLREPPMGLVSPVYAVWTTKDIAAPRFVDLLMKCPEMLAEYERLASGVVKRRRTVSKRSFLGIPVALPPLEDQQAIAHVLSQIQRHQDATDGVILAARELGRSLMRHLFANGYMDVNSVLQDSRATVELADLIAWGPQNGLYKHQREYGVGVPIVRIDTFPTEGAVLTSAASRVRLSDDELAKYGLVEKDILVNRVNSLKYLGKAALIGELAAPMVFESNMMRFRVDASKVLPEFVFYFLASPDGRTQLKLRAKRAVAQSSINQRDVLSVRLPRLPLQEQERICHAVRSVRNKVAAESQRRDALDVLFRSLLRDLMNGQRRISSRLASGLTSA
jgi:type I restriction enzyme S subunit